MAEILIIDDSVDSRKKIRQVCESLGHKIVGEAVTGREGIYKYEELKPDIVTMDIEMPGMEGVEAVKKILEKDLYAKIIMVSTKDKKMKMFESVKAGAKNYIVKPVTVEKVKKAISHVL